MLVRLIIVYYLFLTSYLVAVIGFLNTTLSSVEGDSVNFSIGVLQGSLDVSVTIMFSTEDVTAKGI